MELKITKDRVLEAAKSCPDAARVLKTLLPEAFDKEYVTFAQKQTLMSSKDAGRALVEVRSSGPYEGSLWLHPDYAWELVNESDSGIVRRQILRARMK